MCVQAEVGSTNDSETLTYLNKELDKTQKKGRKQHPTSSRVSPAALNSEAQEGRSSTGSWCSSSGRSSGNITVAHRSIPALSFCTNDPAVITALDELHYAPIDTLFNFRNKAKSLTMSQFVRLYCHAVKIRSLTGDPSNQSREEPVDERVRCEEENEVPLPSAPCFTPVEKTVEAILCRTHFPATSPQNRVETNESADRTAHLSDTIVSYDDNGTIPVLLPFNTSESNPNPPSIHYPHSYASSRSDAGNYSYDPRFSGLYVLRLSEVAYNFALLAQEEQRKERSAQTEPSMNIETSTEEDYDDGTCVDGIPLFPHDLSSNFAAAFRWCTHMFNLLYSAVPQARGWSQSRAAREMLFSPCSVGSSALAKLASRLSVQFDPTDEVDLSERESITERIISEDGYFATVAFPISPASNWVCHPRTLSNLATETGNYVLNERVEEVASRGGETTMNRRIRLRALVNPVDILRKTPEWEMDSTYCRRCLRYGKGKKKHKKYFRSAVNPLGSRENHCRVCGFSVCDDCLAKQPCYDPAYACRRSPFATDMIQNGRKICKKCERKYKELQRRRYKVALLLYANLDILEIAMCRVVPVFSAAANLCLSEYRAVLHTCEGSILSLRSPLEILLMNSVHLFCPGLRNLLSDPFKREMLFRDPTINHSAMKPFAMEDVHREPLLLLFRYIAERGYWNSETAINPLISTVINVIEISLQRNHFFPSSCITESSFSSETREDGTINPCHDSTLNESHFALLCTKACGGMHRALFIVKVLEYLLPAHQIGHVRIAIAKIIEKVVMGYRSPEEMVSPRSADEMMNSSTTTEIELEYIILCLLHLVNVQEDEDQIHGIVDVGLFKTVILPFASLNLRCALHILCFLWVQHAKKKDTRFTQGDCEHLSALFQDPTIKPPLEAFLGFFSSWTEAVLTARKNKNNSCLSIIFKVWVTEFCSAARSVRRNENLCEGHSLTPVEDDVTTRMDETRVPTDKKRGKERKWWGFLPLPAPLPNPFNPKQLFYSIDQQAVDLSSSSAGAMWIRFSHYTADQVNSMDKDRMESSTTQVLFKSSDVEKDQLMCLSVKMLQQVLEKEIRSCGSYSAASFTGHVDPPLRRTPESTTAPPSVSPEDAQLSTMSMLLPPLPSYASLALTKDFGLVERVSGQTLTNVASIEEFLRARFNGSGDDTEEAFRTLELYRRSVTFFILLNYVFAIGDRHADNVMINDHGAIFHVDFGYILSERTLFDRVFHSKLRIDDNILNPFRVFSCFSRGSGAHSYPYPYGYGHMSVGRRNETEHAAVEALYVTASQWYIKVLPCADLFSMLWRSCSSLSVQECPTSSLASPLEYNQVGRSSLSSAEGTPSSPLAIKKPLSESERLNVDIFNRLFDRYTNKRILQERFILHMRRSVNSHRLTDTTRAAIRTIHTISKYSGVSSLARKIFTIE